MRLPRTLPSGRRLQPYSQADAPYFRSPGFYVRIAGLAAVVGIAIFLLALRAWSIQVLHGPQYSRLAAGQAFRTVDLRGARGAIVDSKGRLLAGTVGRLVVVADVGSLGTVDAHGVWHASGPGAASLARLSRLAHVPVETLESRIRRSVVQSPFAPAVVLPHPVAALTSYVMERGAEFPGLRVNGEPARSYPQGALGSEFLGLLGEVSSAELGTTRYAHAKAGEIVGQSGVEATYDRVLNGGLRPARVPVDSMGRIAGPLRLPHDKRLPTLQLTIDAALQRHVVKAVQDGIALAERNGQHPTGGSAVVMNPHTGAILALASVPSYNQVAAANSPGYAAHLYAPGNTQLVDRAIAGVYPTGSVFKPVIAEAALSAGIITPWTQQLCSGSFTLGGFTFHNVEAGVYSYMSLPTALEESCDTWFYRLGDRIWQSDPARKGTLIQRWAHRLGLGQPTGVDLTGEASGLVPSPAWFRRTYHYPWPEGQTINLSIGQGALQASPLQVAVAYSALVNGGRIVRPHVAAATIRGRVRTPLAFPPVRRVQLKDVWAIRQGLYDAAHDSGGTSAAVFGDFPVAVAGKTGTAETCRGCDDHSWYASWAPFDHPKVVVVAMIEHGGFGASAAAPTVKEIYESYFHVKPTASS